MCTKLLSRLSVYIRKKKPLALLAFIWMYDLFNMLSFGDHRVFLLKQGFCENATECQRVMSD